jgi:5'(3')-deoxyribonucleotidase
VKQHVHERMSSKGWCASLEVFPGAVEGVAELRKYAEVFFVTAPFKSEHWMPERRDWLQDTFKIPHWHIIQTSTKFLVRGEVFVDDKPSHVIDWVKYMPGAGVGLLWDRPHNRSSDIQTRVHSWEEVVRFVRASFGV